MRVGGSAEEDRTLVSKLRRTDEAVGAYESYYKQMRTVGA